MRKILLIAGAFILLIPSVGWNSLAAGSVFYGEAAWYGRHDRTDSWIHKTTASGEAFDENALTCAMRRRDFGQWYKVTNLENGRSVIVKHNDYGPAMKWRDPRTGKTHDLSRRVIDLSKGAFGRIASRDQGLLKRVKVERIAKPRPREKA